MKQETKKTFNRIIACLVFLALVCSLLTGLTYLFRNTGRDARMNLLAFYEEPKDSLDVVMVGGSSVYLYFDPMQAYENYGFTSFDYATASAAAAAMTTMIREVEKTQSPQVIVCEVRRLLSTNLDRQVDMSLQNVLDSIDGSWNRLRGVNYFRKVNDLSWSDMLPELFELYTYHDHREVLAGEQSWEYADNRADASLDGDIYYKNFAITAQHTYLDEPEAVGDACTALDPVAEQIFRDLLEYCTKEKLTMLPMSAPFHATAQEQMEINEMARIAAEYGYDFLDCNHHLEEIGLDFTTDFYNDNHVNILGAQKYTDYLSRYLVTNYGLENHYSQQSDWAELYPGYAAKIQIAVDRTLELIADKEVTLEKEAQAIATTDVREYLSLLNDANITLFLMAPEGTQTWVNEEEEFLLDALGLEQRSLYEGGALAVFEKGVLYASGEDEAHSGRFGDTFIKYEMSLGENPTLCIDGVDYYFVGSEKVGAKGLQVVAFDHCFGRVFDRAVLAVEESGEFTLYHLED